MKHLMPQLPYASNALAPALSAETLNFHYGKHLQTYVDNLNKLIAGTDYEGMSLEEIVCKADGALFNNAAQTWNHAFYFSTFSPSPRPMSAHLTTHIAQSFGSVETFKEKMLNAAAGLFGAGWTWLVADKKGGELSIVNESNAGCPLRNGLCPLLTIDVWEHAYYIDYRNRRADYLKAVWNLIDWEIVERRLDCEKCNVYI